MKALLFYREGKSDKVYHVQLEKEGSGWSVNFQFGRRGSTLNCGQKTSSPVSYDEAEKIYNKVVNEKLAKGYQPIEGTVEVTTNPSKVKPITERMLPQLLNAVDDPESYIQSDEFLAQEKFDGERRIIQSKDGEITQYNRKGQVIPITEIFASPIKYDCILDGEMVENRYYIFDILQLDGKDTRTQSNSERLRTLNTLKFGEGFQVVHTAYTEKDKRKLYYDLLKNNKEGIVFKRKAAPYQAGRPASGGDSLKVKFTKTATFIVANHTKGKRSVGLELIDGDKRVFVGKVTIAPNKDIPAVGSLVEVRYLYCFKGGAVYQPSYLGVRTDIDIEDAQLSQVIYKAENEDN